MKRIVVSLILLISVSLIGCNKDKSIPSNALAQGKEHALEAKKALGGQLLKALGEGGTLYALDYCNLEASTITTNVSKNTGTQISRASDQYRNPKNAANKDELAYILKTKGAIAEGNEPQPEIKRISDKLVAYYPIMTNGMCLQCHGTPGKELLLATEEKIKTLYPNDMAVGYDVNQLRGIWVIQMNEEDLAN